VTRLLALCSGPGCNVALTGHRRRFCSDACARKARRAERVTETSDFGQAAIRMIRAMAKRTGASDIATFALLWELQHETELAVCAAIDALKADGFSWTDLADELGVSRNAISQWRKRRIILEMHAGRAVLPYQPGFKRVTGDAQLVGSVDIRPDAVPYRDTPASTLAVNEE